MRLEDKVAVVTGACGGIGQEIVRKFVADVFTFLAADEANCINGSTLCAEDGFVNFKYPLLPE